MSNYKAISATEQIKVGAGKVMGLVTSSTSTGTITFYDSQEGSTSDPIILATITPAAGSSLNFYPGIYCNSGIYAVIANTLEVTVLFE